MNVTRGIAVLAAIGTLATGCVSVTAPQATTPVLQSAWQDVGMSVGRWEHAYGINGTLRMYRFSASAFAFRFEQATSAMTVLDWSIRFPDAVYTMNGIYFHDDYSPSGAFVSRGKSIGKRSFDADKSGMIVLSPSVRVIDTATERAQISAFTEAAQSYPFLIKEGRSALSADSGLLAERSFIGLDRAGNVYLGTATGESISLYELMKLLSAQPVEWTNAMNLDGGPSTGFVARFPQKDERRNSVTPVSNVIVVTRRPAK